MIPFALASGLITEKSGKQREVRFIELEEHRLTFRTAEPLDQVARLEIFFYDDRVCTYDSVILMHPYILELDAERFCMEYEIQIADESYRKAVQKLDRSYYHYVTKKLEGDDAALAEDYTGYPAKLDEQMTLDFHKQSLGWFQETEAGDWSFIRTVREDGKRVEIALELDHPKLWRQYLAMDVDEFYREYWRSHELLNHPLAKQRLDRIYIGNQFCHHLFPAWAELEKLLDKAMEERRNITLAFTYMRESKISETEELLKKLEKWCINHHTKLELVLNDWGMLSLVREKRAVFLPVLGVLLNKRRKDPRMRYKIGMDTGESTLAENALDQGFFREYLKKEYGIERYEQESCGYRLHIPEGKNSIHIPFYQTNTSQYCPLFARCKEGSRGKQYMAEHCPGYCSSYVFSYPDHLHMAGRYNSLFGYDDQILTGSTRLPEYLAQGLDRIVINLM